MHQNVEAATTLPATTKHLSSKNKEMEIKKGKIKTWNLHKRN